MSAAIEPRGHLWGLWAGFLVALGSVVLAAQHLAALKVEPWHPAQTAVAGFVLALFALVLGMSTFALRETLRDVEETAPAAGAPPSRGGRITAILFRLWTRCLVIGLLGSIPAYGAATASAAWPFAAGALALLVLHAPRRGLLEIRPR